MICSSVYFQNKSDCVSNVCVDISSFTTTAKEILGRICKLHFVPLCDKQMAVFVCSSLPGETLKALLFRCKWLTGVSVQGFKAQYEV